MRFRRCLRRMGKAHISLLTSQILLLFLLTGCGQQASLTPLPPGVLRIVSSLPSRGTTARQTLTIEAAIRAALQQRDNKAGATQVDYVALDDSDEETGEWSREKELDNATSATNDPSVVAYIGPYNSSAAVLAIPITNRAGLLEISPSATWPGLTEIGWDPGEPDKYYPSGHRNFLRMMPPDSKQANAAAQWVARDGRPAVVVLDDGSSYSSGLAHDFVMSGTSLHVPISDTIDLKLTPDADLASQVVPSHAYFYAPSSVGNAAAVALALQDKDSVVYSTDTALDPQFLTQAGTAATRWKILSNRAAPDGHGQYTAFTRSDQLFSTQFAANAYDAANIVLNAIASSARPDRAAILNYVAAATLNQGDISIPIFNDLGDPNAWAITGYTATPSGFTQATTFLSDALAPEATPTP